MNLYWFRLCTWIFLKGEICRDTGCQWQHCFTLLKLKEEVGSGVNLLQGLLPTSTMKYPILSLWIYQWSFQGQSLGFLMLHTSKKKKKPWLLDLHFPEVEKFTDTFFFAFAQNIFNLLHTGKKQRVELSKQSLPHNLRFS